MSESAKNDVGATGYLQSQWEEKCCPIVDGVLFADGRVGRLKICMADEGRGKAVPSVQRLEWTTLKALASDRPVESVEISVLCECMDEVGNTLILAGDGAMGGDGFVAAQSKQSGAILWILFFQESNPFISVTMMGDTITATTNLGTIWRIPLSSPVELELSEK